jgi:diacylglycerol kinase family enzyme
MRLALVTNDASGGGTDAGAVAALLAAAGADVTVHDLGALDGGGAALLAGAPERLVVAGGDGTIGPVAAVAAGAGLPLAVVPTGTANDFARALGLPLDPGEAARAAARRDAPTRGIELLRAGDRPFLNAASVGLSVLAARRARALKHRLGPLAYAAGALRAGVAGRPLPCRVVVDGRELFAGACWQAIVAGTGAFGGGARLDAADPHDGLLDVAVLEAGPRAALVRRAYGMRAGRLADQAGVHHARGRVAELELPAGTRFNVDGEVCELRPARLQSRGERVEVVVA